MLEIIAYFSNMSIMLYFLYVWSLGRVSLDDYEIKMIYCLADSFVIGQCHSWVLLMYILFSILLLCE